MLGQQWRKSTTSHTNGCLEARWRKATASVVENCVEARWRTASASAEGNCVEVVIDGKGGGTVQVRHSKDPGGGVVAFAAHQWQAILDGVRAGAFYWAVFIPLEFDLGEREAFVQGVMAGEFDLPGDLAAEEVAQPLYHALGVELKRADRPAARAARAMGASEVPQSLSDTWPSTRDGAWERLSEHRWRAPHTTPGFVWCVVVCFGETIGRPAKREDEAAAFAELFESAGRIGAHHVACQNGSPVVRPDDEANAGVVGVCWWCGKRPDEHRDGGG